MSGFSSPAITRSVVVLPAPDGPSRTKNAPSGMSSSRCVQRLDVAERLVMPEATIALRHRLTTFSVVGSYAGGGAPWWRTVTTCSSAKRTVGGVRTCSRPASASTT